jgi:uncharacterized protein YdhG (YjbR/CyaY superfamily)
VSHEPAVAAARAQIDAELAALPDGPRAAMEALRRSIQSAAPEAVEAISYGAPAFRYRDRPLVAYRAARNHCSLFPMSPAVIEAHLAELRGYDIAKGTIRFTPERPIPAALVSAIVRDRVGEIDAAARRGGADGRA